MHPLCLGLSVTDVFDLINPALFHRTTFCLHSSSPKKVHEQDVAIFIVLALIIGYHESKEKHQFVCKSSDVVYVELYCAHSSLTIYDTGCSIWPCFLSESSFRMCSLDLLTLLRDICKALLGVIQNLSLSSKGLSHYYMYMLESLLTVITPLSLFCAL